MSGQRLFFVLQLVSVGDVFRQLGERHEVIAVERYEAGYLVTTVLALGDAA